MPQPPKTLHLLSELDGYGLSRQLELLVGHQLCAGQSARVVALRGDRKHACRLMQQGVDVRLLDRRWVRDPFVAARLAAVLRNRNFDLLHVWGQSALNYVRALKRFVPHTAQLVSLPNEDLPMGVALPPTARLSREEFLTEYALPEEATLIAVAGPLVRSQQMDEAIWHFELVRTLYENVRLLIFGNGPDRHRLERFTRLTSEPSAVRFMGYRHDFRELLSHADLFWHTAAEDNATPQTVLEAMATGVPVIANDTANCRRILDDGNTGYLVPENDRAVFARYTRKLMQEPDHARQVGASAAEFVAEEFSVEAMVEAYAERYERCRV